MRIIRGGSQAKRVVALDGRTSADNYPVKKLAITFKTIK